MLRIVCRELHETIDCKKPRNNSEYKKKLVTAVKTTQQITETVKCTSQWLENEKIRLGLIQTQRRYYITMVKTSNDIPMLLIKTLLQIKSEDNGT